MSMLPLAEGLVLSAAAHVSLRGMIHTQESFIFLTALDKSISPHIRAHTHIRTQKLSYGGSEVHMQMNVRHNGLEYRLWQNYKQCDHLV